MGTRSNTLVIESDGSESEYVLVNMYRQFDGYLSGHGQELFDFLEPIVLCNGISVDKNSAKVDRLANGAGCLAAQLVAFFKNDVGGFYLERPTKEAGIGENDYSYILRIDTYNPANGIDVEVYCYKKPIFRGSVKEFGEFIISNENSIS